MSVASIRDLTVKYGKRTAVSNLTVDVPEGSVGLLGPNGAGKTTLLKTLMGFLVPAAGSGTVLGMNVATEGMQIRRSIGLMPEVDCHIPGMNAVAFVAFAGELVGMPRAEAMQRAHEVLEFCGLGEARYRKVETYSTGMKQRIKLAQALVHGPKLLFLDEPTNGLDPAGRDDILGLIRTITRSGQVNVIVSSHLLPDIERACDSVIVMRQGRAVRQGTIAELRGFSQSVWDVELRDPAPAFETVMAGRGATVVSRTGAHYRLSFTQNLEPTALFFRAAMECGAQIRGFQSASRTLEDVFLEAVE